MRRWMTVVSIVLAGCGSASGPAGDLAIASPPDALKAACVHPEVVAAMASGICFTAVDYAQSAPGAIYRLGPDGTVSTVFQRPYGFLTSFAQAPDGTTYFANGVNGLAVYKVDGAVEATVYQHDTYVRQVRVDSRGQLYFSEDSGAGGDATIYKLVNGAAEVFYRVKLSTVEGFFGDFGFDAADRLWLSSSNIIPSAFYLVTDGVPNVVYRSRKTPFMGFRFVDPTDVVFGGQDPTLRRLDLCTGRVSDVYTLPNGFFTQDVNTCPRKPGVAGR